MKGLDETRFSLPAWLLRLNGVGKDSLASGGALVPLDVDSLLDAAREATGLTDFGADDFREPLEVLVDSLEREAALTLMGRLLVRGDILNLLENRLQLAEALVRHTQIREEVVKAPIFIVGLPRSGTSILHELLAQDPRLRAPLSWEARYPWPPSGDQTGPPDPRIAMAENVFTFWNELVPEYRTMHEMGAQIPCECIQLTAHSFRSEEFLGRNSVPSYGGWLATADLAPAYAIHHDLLRALQSGRPAQRWMLKAPSHMMALRWLFAEYPDARIIQTHRDPVQIMGSSVNLLQALCWMRAERVDPALIQASFAGEGLAARLFGAVDFRDSGTIPARQFCDVGFSALMSDPIQALDEVYAWLGLDFTPEVERAMRDYLEAKPRGKHGSHDYGFADLGLDLATERARFADYQARFDVPSEVV
jgi:hypothetical protein